MKSSNLSLNLFLKSSNLPMIVAYPLKSNLSATCLVFSKFLTCNCSRSIVFWPSIIWDSPTTIDCSSSIFYTVARWETMFPLESRVTALPPLNFTRMWLFVTKSIWSISWSYWKPTRSNLRWPGAGLTKKQNSRWFLEHTPTMLEVSGIPWTLR